MLNFIKFKFHPTLIALVVIFAIQTTYSQELAINEFLAANRSVVADQNGEYDDWIELYNYGSSNISLVGFSLTDDSTDINKWTFPDTSIQAGEFLIIWADNDSAQTGLHTGFRLNSSGELIILSTREGVTVDKVIYGRQSTDISYGRIPDGSGSFRTMFPTYSAANSDEEPPIDNSNDTLFAASIVHKYELRFYTDNWQDSLKYNYEVLDQQYMPASMTYNDNIILDSIGVRYKGNSSYIRSGASIKKPFKFKFDKYHKDQSLFDTKILNFSNCVADPSFMREVIGYRVSGAYMASPRAVYANIYIEGELIGLYVQVEQVDEIFLSANFSDNNSNLYKASDDGASMLYLGENQSDYESEYELKTNKNDNNWSNFINLIDVLNKTPDESFVETISMHLNLDNVINHLAFNMVFSSFDSYTGSGRNFYFYEDDDSEKFNIIPWDLNETFGVYTYNWDVITVDIVELGNAAQRPLVRRIMQNDSLRSRYLDRVKEMIEGIASTDSITAMATQLRSLIADHVLADENKLYSSDMFYRNIEEDVRIELGQVVPGIVSFSAERNANIIAQLLPVEVFPGDCDNNGVVDAYDILPLGIYFHAIGPPREGSSNEWQADPTSRWYSKASTYVDANGDGIVDEQDIIGIGVNWGNSHDPSGNSYAVDPNDLQKLSQHRQAFTLIYNSLQGDNEMAAEIKTLLESIINNNPVTAPGIFSLEQNYPNPFNSTTTIRFSIPDSKIVTLTMFDQTGRQLQSPFADKHYNAGWHQLIFDASLLPNGVYLYRLQADNWSRTVRMTLIK